MSERKYPIGIQTFSRIIREGYLYIDKTDLVWELTRVSPYVFLSRPRRFGKSLLSTTLESYYSGDKDLFQGLKISALEEDWEQYPVIHLDLSVVKGQQDADSLASRLMLLLKVYSKRYGADRDEVTPGGMLQGLINRIVAKTGKQVVVLVDEYDAPLLDVLHEDRKLEDMRRVMQEFYSPLKACERNIRFCFITGITKFSQLSIFSTLNNLLNVSLDPRFAAICGITDREMVDNMQEDVKRLAAYYGISKEKMHMRLQQQYDGYHFSRESEGVYNPYSLLKCFQQRDLANYWFESGTPTFLIRLMRQFQTDITQLDDLEVPASAFDQPTENMQNALPVLYQSGYLTIKAYDRESLLYTLSIPNQEVRVGFIEGLMPAYTGLTSGDVQTGFALKFWKALKAEDIDLAMRELQAYLAGISYVEGFKKKLADAATAEGFYEYTFYLIFSMLNVYVRTQVKCAGGRIDMVVWMPQTTYVFEFKTDGTAQEALRQIDGKGYALPYDTGGRPVVKVGVKMDPATRSVENWIIA